MPKLSDSLKKAGRVVPKKKAQEPIWAGPCDSGPTGGITQSLLSRFLCCRERFRLRVVEGLAPVDSFNHRMEYGSMWHICEEAMAAGKDWEGPLKTYAQNLCQRYRLSGEQIQHWYRVCKVQFPIYVKFWAKHPDVKKRTPLLQEETFHVPYTLPSGRVVYLRGKWDGVDLV